MVPGRIRIDREDEAMRARFLGSVAASTVLLFGQAAIVATPAAAASPLTITADMPAAVPAGHNWGFNDFFPRTLRVPTGSTVQFAIEGFHTATLLPAGVSAAADEKANGLAKIDEDPSLNPNGTTHTQLNIPGISPTNPNCGTNVTPCAFDGTAVVSSGASFGPPSGPFVVEITAAPGTYAFHCRIHPGMSGQITVLPSNANGTTPAQLTKTVDHQVKSDVKAGFQAEKRAGQASRVKNADGTTTWHMTAGTSSADGHVAVLEFLPLNLDIHPGDSVVWRSKAVNEPHTVTFPGELNSDLVPLCEGTGGDTPAVPNEIPPTSPFDFHCGLAPFPDEVEFGGGNGVTNLTAPGQVSDSGVFASRSERRSLGLPAGSVFSRTSVSFAGAAPGTYTYICQIHAGMQGTITVH
jgi:plastocyanin